MRTLNLVGLALFIAGVTTAQPLKVVILGSSTAQGVGSQPAADSSWVNRMAYHYRFEDNRCDTIINLAQGGYDPYHAMPSGYTPAQYYSVPDTARNITRALQFSPTIIIVSFVSNNFQVGGLPTDSIMMSLQLIKDSANRAGSVCFITTPQPRTQFSQASRERLKILKDSVLNRFGFYAINFFDCLVDTADLSIADEYSLQYDNIHINNAGHRKLYEQIVAKGIFDLHINRTRQSGEWNNSLTWDKGIIPNPSDSILVREGHSLTLDSNLNVRSVEVQHGALLLLDNENITFSVGDSTVRNARIIVNGKVEINRGTMTVYGSFEQRAQSSFIMNDGRLIISGNTGMEESSVANGEYLFAVDSAVEHFEFNGGVLQIIDPPFGDSSEAIDCPFEFGEWSVLEFGDGISIRPSKQENGFGGSKLPRKIGALILNAATGQYNRVFLNKEPLVVRHSLQVLSGHLVQSALLELEN